MRGMEEKGKVKKMRGMGERVRGMAKKDERNMGKR